MPKTVLTDNLVAAIDHLLVRAKLAGELEHAGMTGTVREVFVSQLIRPLLPDGYRVGTGKIIDRRGALSKQTDVIVYDGRRAPPLMYDEALGVFPIDSVRYAVEVKSTLTASTVDNAIANATHLRTLEGPQPAYVLFGFASDADLPATDLERIRARQGAPPAVNVYCSVGRGYCYWDEALNQWTPAECVQRHAEVIGLLIGIVNTLVNPSPQTVAPGRYLGWWE